MLHSWETALLPYLEQKQLASQIKHDVPWDAPENEACFQQPVNVFLHPSVTRASGETGRFDERGFALSHYAANGWVLGADNSFTIKEITDGTSNTIMAGEVRENFKPWGDPSNFRDPMLGINKSPNGFGGPYRNLDGANFLLVDGSVRFISDKVDPNVLKALSTPAGGENVSEY